MTTSNGVELRLEAPVSSVARLGQATAIEQSRAVAEVQAAVYLAKQFPRDEDLAIKSMENSCRQLFVAERAFYRLPRSGEVINGPTIQLAKELARCWGHIHFGPGEMDRTADRSEMLVYAWDVQSGTRAFSTFIVPHKRDKTDKRTGVKSTVDLVTMQEIYELNANQAARRLREQIFAVLPSWFTERAKQLCRETLDAGDGSPIEDRRAACIAGFATLGITDKQLEQKLDLQVLRWTGHELGQLAVIFRAIKAGEISKDVEFPPDATAITTKDITGGEPEKPAPAPVKPPKPAPAPEPPAEVPTTGESVSHSDNTDAGTVPSEPPAEPETPHASAPEPTTDEDQADGPPSSKGPKARRTQLDAIAKLLDANGAEAREDKLAVLSLMLDQPIPAANVLSDAEATYVFNRIETKVQAGEFAELLERARRIAAGG